MSLKSRCEQKLVHIQKSWDWSQYKRILLAFPKNSAKRWSVFLFQKVDINGDDIVFINFKYVEYKFYAHFLQKKTEN